MTQRDAMRYYLARYQEIEPFERSFRRREASAIVTLSLGVVANVTVPAWLSAWPYSLVNYACAVYLALALRHWVLASIARRRAWKWLEFSAAVAAHRLATEGEDDDRSP